MLDNFERDDAIDRAAYLGDEIVVINRTELIRNPRKRSTSRFDPGRWKHRRQ